MLKKVISLAILSSLFILSIRCQEGPAESVAEQPMVQMSRGLSLMTGALWSVSKAVVNTAAEATNVGLNFFLDHSFGEVTFTANPYGMVKGVSSQIVQHPIRSMIITSGAFMGFMAFKTHWNEQAELRRKIRRQLLHGKKDWKGAQDTVKGARSYYNPLAHDTHLQAVVNNTSSGDDDIEDALNGRWPWSNIGWKHYIAGGAAASWLLYSASLDAHARVAKAA